MNTRDNSLSSGNQRPMPSAMDYDFLRQEGIRHIESMAGGEWTDFNEHDPGITILEQFCYALTDLAYRIGYDIKDLLADGESDPYRSLPSPAEVLTTQPVTLCDFRKVLIDLEGVRNAWIEPVENPQPPLFSDLADACLYLEPAPHRESLVLRGVFQVLVESDGTLPDTNITKAVDTCLQGCRNLGQEFLPAKILADQKIAVEATVEIGSTEDAGRVSAEILHALSRFISPYIRFYTLAERLALGLRIDEIFDGPALRRGFIDTDELESFGRKNGLRVSDLIQEIMNVAGVGAVDSIRIGTGGKTVEPWYLSLDQDSTPVLDLEKSTIALLRDGIVVNADPERVRVILKALREGEQPGPLPEAERDITLVPGRDRKAGRYHSIQHQFPLVYGIGEFGLPPSASPQRRAQALQLKAYLLFFDQLLANGFAQLAHAKSLFSFDLTDPPQTYFSQRIDEPRLGLDGLWANPDLRDENLRNITESSAYERKNRFLNHLLARFAEDFADFSQCGDGADIVKAQIQAKCLFLQDFRRLGAARGGAFDCTLPTEADNVSGLARRICRKLGLSPNLRRKLADLTAQDEGGFHLVEHILLRPRQADQAAAQQGLDVGAWQAGVLLALPADSSFASNPYTQQISLVFPGWLDCFKQAGFAEFIGRLLREETPAHLHVRLLWLDPKEMGIFENAYQDWLDKLDTLNQVSGNTFVRDARDRLIECLRLGTPYPLRDVDLEYERIVGVGHSSSLRIHNAQAGVSYTLCDENGDPVTDALGQPIRIKRETGLTAATAELPLPTITKDISFTLLASRETNVYGIALANPLDVYLAEVVSVKVGINTSLRVEFKPAGKQKAEADQITVDYADTVKVAVQASQPGISYELVTSVDSVEKSLSPSVKGDKGTIVLESNVTFKQTSFLRIKAYRTLVKTDAQYLDTRLTVWVRPNPKLVASANPAVINYAAHTGLTLAEAQTNVAYQLFKRELLTADYPIQPSADPKVVEGTANRPNKEALTLVGDFQWNNGKCVISVDPLFEDTLFFVQATHLENQERLWLESPVAVLVRPNPAPKLAALVTTIPANTEAMITVSDTQKGVNYQLRQQAGNVAVNPPGYHWEDRGIETARLEVDWVVGQPDQPEDYKTLRLPTGKLAAETVFQVLAVKSLTGLDAPLTDTVKIGIGS